MGSSKILEVRKSWINVKSCGEIREMLLKLSKCVGAYYTWGGGRIIQGNGW